MWIICTKRFTTSRQFTLNVKLYYVTKNSNRIWKCRLLQIVDGPLRIDMDAGQFEHQVLVLINLFADLLICIIEGSFPFSLEMLLDVIKPK